MIKLIVDTTSEILPKEAKELGIISLPLKLVFDETEYTSGVDLTNEEFYEKLRACKQLPHTSQLNVDDYTKAIKPLIEDGQEVFVMCISNKLSGSFNSLEQAYKELNSDKVEILNTYTVSFAYQALVFEAIKMIKKGCSLSQLKTEIEKLSKRVELLAIVDNVTYLIKGGRLSVGLGFLAKTLHIKPIVGSLDGGIHVVAKALGQNNARKTVKNLIKDFDPAKPIFIAHADNIEKMEKLRDYIEAEMNIKVEKCCEIGPIIGTHSGPNCVGISYFKKEK